MASPVFPAAAVGTTTRATAAGAAAEDTTGATTETTATVAVPSEPSPEETGAPQPDRERDRRAPRLILRRHDIVISGVSFRSLVEIALRVRCATDVSMSVYRGIVQNEAELRASLLAIDWSLYFRPGTMLAIGAASRRSAIYHERLVEEAATASVERFGIRVGAAGSGLDGQRITIDLVHNRMEIWLSLCGSPLWKRGYRGIGRAPAPLREDLAQCCIRRTVPVGAEHLAVPFCGTGTLLFEFLIREFSIPLFLFGRSYAVDSLACALPETTAWLRRKLREQLAERILTRGDARRKVVAVLLDIEPEAVAAAMDNLSRFLAPVPGLESVIRCSIEREDAFARPWSSRFAGNDGTFLLNPPYGVRIGTRSGSASARYRRIGAALSQRDPEAATSGFILCPDERSWRSFVDAATGYEVETSHFSQGGRDIRLCAFRHEGVPALRSSAASPL